MKILSTADGERIVMDDDTADFLLGAEGEALLRRKAERAQIEAETAIEIAAREQEDRIEEWQERRALEEP